VATDAKLSSFKLRVKVVGGGCAGFAYDLSFDTEVEDEVSATDLLVVLHEVSFVVDQMSLMYLRGTEIDYVDTLQGAGFKFNNPNVTSTCGCGQSFRT